jgi:hypothetical protein
VGNVQQMVFSPTDAGRCWMLPEEQETKQKDKTLSATNGISQKKELLEKQKEKNVTYKGNMKGLKCVAANYGITVSEEIQKVE